MGKIVGNYSPFTLEIFSLIVSYKKGGNQTCQKREGGRGVGGLQREKERRGGRQNDKLCLRHREQLAGAQCPP